MKFNGLYSYKTAQNAIFFIFCLYIYSVPSINMAASFLETAKVVIKISPDVQIALKDKQIATAAVNKAWSKYLPQISWKIGGSLISEEYEKPLSSTADSKNDYNDISSTVSLSQDILNIQKIYAIKISKSRIISAVTKVDQVKQKVLLDFGLAWTAYWKALRHMEIGEENIKILDQYRKKSRIRYRAGEITITDVRLAETRFQGALSQKNKFLRELNRARNDFGLITKELPPGNIDLFSFSMGKDNFTGFELKMELHPVIRSMIAELSALEMEIKQQRSGHYPTLEFNSSYKYQLEGEYETSNYPYREGKIGLELNIPLFSGGGVVDATNETIGRKKQHVIKIKQAKDKILSDIRTGSFDLKQSMKEIGISEKQLEYAYITLKSMNEEYDLGTRTVTDVFQVQADMINAKLAVVSAKEQHAKSLISYIYLVGKLHINYLKTVLK